MKKLIFLLFIQSAFSQIEKNIGDFQELKVLDGINVVLEKGEQNVLKITVEWEKSDLVYRLDGKEVHRNIGLGDNYPEPMFAILNFAKITWITGTI